MEAVPEFAVRHSLHLGSDWTIDRMRLDAEAQRIDIYISHAGRRLICPKTGETGTLYDHRKARSWRHLDWFQFQCFVHCRVPRVKSCAGVNTIEVPWSSASQRFTEAFESWTIRLLQATKNQTKTAQLLRCKFDVVNRILHRSVARGERRRNLHDISHVSVDEKAIHPKYATVVSDSERGVVLDVGQGRDKISVRALLQGLLGDLKDEIQTITTDMWKAYISCVTELFPSATLIHDRFHLIQYLNQAIDQVRRREVKQHDELKHSRYALLKNEANRTASQEDIFQAIQKLNLQVSIAWRLREEFKAIFRCRSFADAKTYFKLWLERVNEEAVQEVLQIAEMFERHRDGVCNALCHEQSNARAERINGKIQEVKTVGRGYRTFKNFRSAILFFHGGLDLYPQYSR
ncbi:MAG: ISL3 family transposase [Rhodothermaceae bacterium]|nr:ISL3 family transposase [Rhodothermaceae bacterium]MXZ56965.1 ISL3 family transposase [Rhodothermaceae bacterium]MYD67931.1 ISL3 family transposase [Rhodothermaceae bacterium]MYH11678.1 ISL3 family transposase [Rhodothermaceae bacterium]MYJ07982.1 ISL3 family transposase [Rhodothermaceae bacterium]